MEICGPVQECLSVLKTISPAQTQLVISISACIKIRLLSGKLPVCEKLKQISC